jgi:hypothetical protein
LLLLLTVCALPAAVSCDTRCMLMHDVVAWSKASHLLHVLPGSATCQQVGERAKECSIGPLWLLLAVLVVAAGVSTCSISVAVTRVCKACCSC